eukprot:GGOE01004425.1.p1 GENE.GGOE01004425.1~~GGOE01004425.1.p1  ORF type:complete len:287 (+),score=49.32 GGOE01004425.1:63-923(+)
MSFNSAALQAGDFLLATEAPLRTSLPGRVRRKSMDNLNVIGQVLRVEGSRKQRTFHVQRYLQARNLPESSKMVVEPRELLQCRLELEVPAASVWARCTVVPSPTALGRACRNEFFCNRWYDPNTDQAHPLPIPTSDPPTTPSDVERRQGKRKLATITPSPRSSKALKVRTCLVFNEDPDPLLSPSKPKRPTQPLPSLLAEVEGPLSVGKSKRYVKRRSTTPPHTGLQDQARGPVQSSEAAQKGGRIMQGTRVAQKGKRLVPPFFTPLAQVMRANPATAAAGGLPLL